MERFKDKFYVADDPKLKNYFGIPLKNSEGIRLGVLCVLDKEPKSLTPEKIELLRIIGDEIVNRLKSIKAIQELKKNILEIKETHKKVAHDIRAPIGGIIGLAAIISEQGDQNKLEEVLEFIHLIQKSGKSVLELADEILSASYSPDNQKNGFAKQTSATPGNSEFNLHSLRERLLNMYAPQALQKKVDFEVNNYGNSQEVAFPKNKLLQIIGNLVSNAIKFTPSAGKVRVNLNLLEDEFIKELKIEVADTGPGISQKKIMEILKSGTDSTDGTRGEKGYGFGLELVKHLLEKMNGSFQVESDAEQGS